MTVAGFSIHYHLSSRVSHFLELWPIGLVYVLRTLSYLSWVMSLN